MAVTINKSDGTVLTIIQDGAVDVSSTNLALIGRLYRNYGELVNENFVKLLENFASSSSPTAPIVGQIWFDTSSNVLKVYRSTGFVSLGRIAVSTVQPNNPVIGDQWYDTVDNQLKIYNGIVWDVVAPSYNSSQGKTGLFVETIRDTLSVNHVCMVYYQQSSVVAIHCRDAQWTPLTAISGLSVIKPGFNLANVSGQQFVGQVVDSTKLGGLDAETYVRNDISGAINGSLSLSDDGLFIGASEDFNIFTTAGDAYVTKTEGNIKVSIASVEVLNINEDYQTLFSAGNESIPSISFLSDNDSGMYSISDGVIGVSINGFNIVEISENGLFINGDIQAASISAIAVSDSVTAGNLIVLNNTTLGNATNDITTINGTSLRIPNGLSISQGNLNVTTNLRVGGKVIHSDGTSDVTIANGLIVEGDIYSQGNLVTDGGFNFADLFKSTTLGTVIVNRNNNATGYYNTGDVSLGNNVVSGINRNNAIFARNVPKHLCVFNGTLGGAVVYNAHHIATVTRSSTGVYVLTLSDDSGIDIPLISLYPEVIVTVNGTGHGSYDVITNSSQTSITIRTYNTSGTATDYTRISVAIWDGDVI